MNRKELISRITGVMRERNIRKPVSSPKKVFHISDDEGNTRDFIVRRTDAKVLFNNRDVGEVIDACIFVIEDAIRHGESISIPGFGTLALKYRKERATKRPNTEEWVKVDARYIPKFSFGNELRLCAKLYELSLQDGALTEPLPVFDDTDEQDETDGGR